MTFRRNSRLAKRSVALMAAWFAGVCLAPRHLPAQFPAASPAASEDAARDLSAESLPLRTALHYDATIEAPFEQLVGLFQKPGRLDELVTLYRSHVAQYAADENARIVFVRLLRTAGAADATAVARDAVKRHPENAYLRFLHYQELAARGSDAALPELDAAIERQADTRRKREWIKVFVPAADRAGLRPAVDKHLKAIGAAAATPEERVEIAKEILGFARPSLALELLNRDAAGEIVGLPETMVEREFTAAKAEMELQQFTAAAARLDRLLERLNADYWRRSEIAEFRIRTARTPAERETLLTQAKLRYEASPRDEAAALDYAKTLTVLQRRREALDVLIAAGRRLPTSVRIEREIIQAYQRLHDDVGREQYFAQRVRDQPARRDLAVLHVRSLYDLGKSTEAAEALTRVVAAMPEADRVLVQLDMARGLRKSSRHEESAALFAAVVTAAPERYDVRRELAEAHLSLGDRAKARAAVAVELPADVALETVFDLAQFMGASGMPVEARRLLDTRKKAEPENLELRLQVLALDRRLGYVAEGIAEIAATRAIADTGPRYRQWLDAAVAFHEEAGETAEFLEQEWNRLRAEDAVWTLRRQERFFAFLSVEAGTEFADKKIALVKEALAAELPADVRNRLRRELIAAESKAIKPPADLLDQLKQLAKDDPTAADESRVRAALVVMRSNRSDLFTTELKGVDFRRINDPALLNAVMVGINQYGIPDPAQRRRLLERLTQLDPTNRMHWETWLAQLVGDRDEERLRGEIQKLLAGTGQLPLADEIRKQLELHLAHSYWRSLARDIQRSPDGSEETLSLLDAVERQTVRSGEAIWIAWLRAVVLDRQGRRAEADEAIREVERLAAVKTAAPAVTPPPPPSGVAVPSLSAAPPARPVATAVPVTAAAAAVPAAAVPAAGAGAGPTDTEPRIDFPDGLSLSLRAAVDHLRASRRKPAAGEPATIPAAAAPPIDVPEAAAKPGPRNLPTARVLWSFNNAASPIRRLAAVGRGRLLAVDAAGTMSAIDVKTGKLLWERTGDWLKPSNVAPGLVASPMGNHPSTFAPVGSYYYPSPSMSRSGPPNSAENVAYDLLSLDDGRFVLSEGQTVYCYDPESGAKFWECRTAGAGDRRRSLPLPARVFRLGAELVAFEPISSNVVVIDPKNGKVLREWNLAAALPPAPTAVSNTATPNVPAGYGIPAVYGSYGSAPYGYASSGGYAPQQALPSAGASLWGRRLLFYGTQAGVVDLDTGEIVIRFDQGRAVQFPVRLDLTAPPAGRHGGRNPYYQAGHLAVVPTFDLNQVESQYAMSGAPFRLAAPAAAWADTQQQNRFGRLFGDRLFLSNQNGFWTIPAATPIQSLWNPQPGRFLAEIAGTVCLTDGRQLQLVDLHDGESRLVSLPDEVGSAHGAVVDGVLLHVVGTGGVACINPRTMTVVSTVSWSALLKTTPPKTAVTQEEIRGMVMAFQMGDIGQSQANPAYPAASCEPVLVDGRLIAAATATRIVCLADWAASDK